jgi:hypothetical protein
LTELTRRQMRELERSGQALDVSPPQAAATTLEAEPTATHTPGLIIETTPREPALTRREMRLRAEAQASSSASGELPNSTSNFGRASALAKSIAVEAQDEPASNEIAESKPEISERSRPEAPERTRLPAVGESRRSLRQHQPGQAQPESKIEALEAVEIEIPEEGLRGANYLGEPSTQSIVLEVAPEAMSLSVDTGEIFTTGSIAILPDATGSLTGSLDGIDLDTEEAVTGVISIVEPISARDLIDERSPLGVVPDNILRKGWWRPWAVGALSLLMAIAAILASITIFNALGD